MVVKNKENVSIYDYDAEAKTWGKVGDDITLELTDPVAVSISGDGTTILISMILGGRNLISHAYRQTGGNSVWIQYGITIKIIDQFCDNTEITNTLSHDGNYMSLGSRRSYRGINDEGVSNTYKAPKNKRGRWIELRNCDDIGHGPFVFMIDQQQTLITGGNGIIQTQSIGDSFFTSKGKNIRYLYHRSDKVLEGLVLAVATTDHHYRMAYTASGMEDIIIMERNINGNEWIKKAELPIRNVKALSFSDDGNKLAVGVPEFGNVFIYKFYYW